ncbi:MAG TPA: histidine phosphatase family protein [Janthinobacterium sp.]|jgi:alpha-ribazole phosphatase|nr:histidine phosphatase family protein [Janthinobacterium sp.]
MRLILVRHPRTIAAPGLCYGSTDLAVAPDDLARVLAALQADLPPDAPVFSSPLQRCALLATALKHPSLTFDPRLAEMDFGDWEMRHWQDIPRAEIDAWSDDLAGYRPGGGESVLALAARVGAFRDEVRRLPHDSVIAICHAGTMRLLCAWTDGLPLAEIARKAAGAPHRIAYGELLLIDC